MRFLKTYHTHTARDVRRERNCQTRQFSACLQIKIAEKQLSGMQ